MTPHRLVAMFAARLHSPSSPAPPSAATATAKTTGGHGNSANAPGHQQAVEPGGCAVRPRRNAATPAAPDKHAAKGGQAPGKQSSTSPSQPRRAEATLRASSLRTTRRTTPTRRRPRTRRSSTATGRPPARSQRRPASVTRRFTGREQQPHKTMCGPHEVDVHALKHKAAKCGAAESAAGHEEKVKVEKVELAAAKSKETEAAKSESRAVSESAHRHVTYLPRNGLQLEPVCDHLPSASGVFHAANPPSGWPRHCPAVSRSRTGVSPRTGTRPARRSNNACMAVHRRTRPSPSRRVIGGGRLGLVPCRTHRQRGRERAGRVGSCGAAAPTWRARPPQGAQGAVVALHPTRTKPSVACWVRRPDSGQRRFVAPALHGPAVVDLRPRAAALIAIGVAVRRRRKSHLTPTDHPGDERAAPRPPSSFPAGA